MWASRSVARVTKLTVSGRPSPSYGPAYRPSEAGGVIDLTDVLHVAQAFFARGLRNVLPCGCSSEKWSASLVKWVGSFSGVRLVELRNSCRLVVDETQP